MYFATIEYYQKTKQILMDDNFEKWTYGPVIRKIYQEYRKFSFLEITESQINEDDADKLKKTLHDKPMIEKIITKSFKEKLKWSLDKLIDESHTGELWTQNGNLITSNEIEKVYGK